MFSVVVPTYNHEAYLAFALESLLAQSRDDWEAVVVNDGSTDGTAKVMAHYAQKDARIRTFHKANGGVSSALNEGIRNARGEWICWLSSDDLFEPEALGIFAQAIQDHPAARFFHSDFFELDHESGRKTPGPAGRQSGLPLQDLQTIAFFSGNYVHGISICIQRTLFEKAGAFDPDLKYAQDMDMWLRLSALAPMHFIDRRLCITRVHSGMGTMGFPEAGILDSARACLTFLNRHRFGALFPFLDLKSSDGVTRAIQATLRVALNPLAVMYQGVGHVPALLERLEEWVFEDCPVEFREGLLDSFSNLAGKSASLPQALQVPLIRMGSRKRGFYVQRDPVEAMRKNLEDLWYQGNPAAAQLLKRYLEKVVGDKPTETENESSPVAKSGEAFLFEPDWASPEWIEIVLSYVIAFAPGEPVSLILVLDPGTGKAISLEEAQQSVLQIMTRSGREAFPDIVLLDNPDELLGIIRHRQGIQWIPRGRGHVEGLTGSFSVRLAEARNKMSLNRP